MEKLTVSDGRDCARLLPFDGRQARLLDGSGVSQAISPPTDTPLVSVDFWGLSKSCGSIGKPPCLLAKVLLGEATAPSRTMGVLHDPVSRGLAHCHACSGD